jgi:hypothetical protein
MRDTEERQCPMMDSQLRKNNLLLGKKNNVSKTHPSQTGTCPYVL